MIPIVKLTTRPYPGQHKSRHSEINDILVARELNLNTSPYYFRRKIYGNVDLTTRLKLHNKLEGHDGCVNTVAWNKKGDLILSGSDDCHLNIWNPELSSPLIASIPSGHQRNIFSAHFLANSNDRKIVSCAMDGATRFTDLDVYESRRASDSWNPSPAFHCHTDLTYEVAPDPIDPNVFFDCSDDGKVNSYDLRIRTSCNCQQGCERHTILNINPEDALISLWGNNLKEIRGMNIRPDNPVYFAVSCSDDSVRVYDRRFVSRTQRPPPHVYGFVPGHIREKHANHASSRLWRLNDGNRITSLKFDPSGTGELLISYSRDIIRLVKPDLGTGNNLSANKRDQKDATFTASSRKKNKDCRRAGSPKMGESEEVGTGTPTSLMDTSGAGSDIDNETSPKTEVNEDYKRAEQTLNEVLPAYSEVVEPGASPVDFPQGTIRDHTAALLGLDDDESDDSDVITEESRGDIDTVLGGEDDIVQCYGGHLNSETMIKEANFYGLNSEYIVSGSDDGRIFIWDRFNGEIKHLLIGDSVSDIWLDFLFLKANFKCSNSEW
ncbi:hypothetical protein K7432_011238 [Basidiobolus ranarum]|uniref:Uncharacterized protein n=1 Tax=Basidiobolus ranarum TaxID=34480 RepID=A0ABR2VU73_9FUNG